MNQNASSASIILLNKDMYRKENDQNHSTKHLNLGLTVVILSSKYSDDMSSAKLKSAIAI